MRRLLLCCLLLALTFLFFHSDPPISAELVPVDQSELGERIPLVLIHGIRPSKNKQYDWDLFLNRAEALPGFSTRYKPYLFIYPPSELISKNAQSLHDALRDYKKNHPDSKPFRFVAQSLGGIVVREALNDPQLWQQTDRVIAIGTSFHGSPLTNSDWMRARLKEESLISQFRQLNRISYWVFGRMFPNYKEDLCWDNFNAQMPEIFARKHTCRAKTSIHSPEEDIQKYIVYAGFFGETPEESQLLGEFLKIPKERIGKKANPLLNKHLISYLMRRDLAYVPLKTNGNKDSRGSLMWYNDGISPIISQLWLGRYLQASPRPIPAEAEWLALKTLQNSQQARLFEGLDHADWLKSTTRYQNSDTKLLDWLHPDQPPKDIFNWLLSDLLR